MSQNNAGVASIAEQVATIWKDVLDGAGSAGPDASFFELSGDSIAAVRLVGLIEDELGVEIEVGDIFEDDPTLADLIRTVEAA